MMTFNLTRWCRAIGFILLFAPALPGAVQAQMVGEISTVSEEARERASASVRLIQSLLELEQSLQEQVAEKAQIHESQLGDEDKKQLEQISAELAKVRAQISEAATGVSAQDYGTFDAVEFDLNAEVQGLLEPFILILNEATSDARQLERTRRDLDLSRKRLESTRTALANINLALLQNPTPAVDAQLQDSLQTWQERQELHETQVQALMQRVSDLQSQSGSVGTNINSAFQTFFRDRSISLLMGIGAFVGFLLIARLVFNIAQRILLGKTKEKTFAWRLAAVIYTILSILGSFGVILLVFNMRNDWLLLGLAMLLLIAALWLTIRMLPNLIEQLWIILNLGAVQERERVLFNGVPFRVERLGPFTDLVNPALDGGEFTLPVRQLIGMHSRPAAVDEAWFPSKKGDWVKLADGNAGRVVAQTPEMVVVELLGGAHVTYQTADYLSATPENLSNGYRVEIEFGIGYGHQSEATDRIIAIMTDGIRRHFTALLAPDELLNVDVEFLRAGASSLDYEVEIDVAGSAAHRFEELERELARLMVMLANAEGWEIPFQQVVLHRPSEPNRATT